MPVFRCGRFPAGEVPIRTTAGLVHFQDGRAVVESLGLAQALREVPAVFEITEEGGAPSSASPSRPAQTKTRRPMRAKEE